MIEKELFDQLNLKFSNLEVNVGDLYEVIGNGSFWERNSNSPGRQLCLGEMLLIIEKTPNPGWVVVIDKNSNVGEVCIRVFERD